MSLRLTWQQCKCIINHVAPRNATAPPNRVTFNDRWRVILFLATIKFASNAEADAMAEKCLPVASSDRCGKIFEERSRIEFFSFACTCRNLMYNSC